MNPRPLSMVVSNERAATLGADDYKEPQIVLSAFKNDPANRAGGKGILIQDEHTGALSTLSNQYVLDNKQ